MYKPPPAPPPLLQQVTQADAQNCLEQFDFHAPFFPKAEGFSKYDMQPLVKRNLRKESSIWWNDGGGGGDVFWQYTSSTVSFG